MRERCYDLVTVPTMLECASPICDYKTPLHDAVAAAPQITCRLEIFLLTGVPPQRSFGGASNPVMGVLAPASAATANDAAPAEESARGPSALLRDNLSLPVVGAPLFIVSNPDLVIEQCKAGIVGAFPALNARPKEVLETWLKRITTELRRTRRSIRTAKVAPFAVNQIVHSSNDRLQHDIDLCEKYKVPIQITSLRAPDEVVRSGTRYGCLVFHDVTNVAHAKRALQAGVDGLILVCAGAGGHAGRLSPFALVPEVRQFYDGCLLLSGAIANGGAVLAAQAVGADLAYIGTRFIASKEANAPTTTSSASSIERREEIVYTNLFTGVHGNYLKRSIAAAGLDPDDLPEGDKSKMNFGSGGNAKAKAWRDIWGAGQGVGQIDDAPPAAEIVARLKAEYRQAQARAAMTVGQ